MATNFNYYEKHNITHSYLLKRLYRLIYAAYVVCYIKRLRCSKVSETSTRFKNQNSTQNMYNKSIINTCQIRLACNPYQRHTQKIALT